LRGSYLFESDRHRRRLLAQRQAHAEHDVVRGDVLDLEAARNISIVVGEGFARLGVPEIGVAIGEV
jgi:hypothetical protein